jgi:voltage-gated potassium channel
MAMVRSLVDRLRRAWESPLAELVIVYVAGMSVIIVVADMVKGGDPGLRRQLYLLDAAMVSLLIADYCYRLAISGSPARYLKRTFYEVPALMPLALLDAIESHLSGLGLFRLFRVARLFRLALVMAQSSRLVGALARTATRMHVAELGVVVSLTLVAGSLAVYIVEYGNPGSGIRGLGDAFWWALATATTVGYGDIVPSTSLGRLIGSLFMIMGITLITILVSVLGASIYETIASSRQDSAVKSRIKRRVDEIEKLTENEVKALIRDIIVLWRASNGNAARAGRGQRQESRSPLEEYSMA